MFLFDLYFETYTLGFLGWIFLVGFLWLVFLGKKNGFKKKDGKKLQLSSGDQFLFRPIGGRTEGTVWACKAARLSRSFPLDVPRSEVVV